MRGREAKTLERDLLLVGELFIVPNAYIYIYEREGVVGGGCVKE